MYLRGQYDFLFRKGMTKRAKNNHGKANEMKLNINSHNIRRVSEKQ